MHLISIFFFVGHDYYTTAESMLNPQTVGRYCPGKEAWSITHSMHAELYTNVLPEPVDRQEIKPEEKQKPNKTNKQYKILTPIDVTKISLSIAFSKN